MKPQELFEIWAPPNATWSPWAKPILFSRMFSSRGPSGLGAPIPGYGWAPRNDGQTAIVLNLAGAQGIMHALICARHGFRPVPLYNAASGHGEIVAQAELIDAAFDATPDLQNLALPPDAPPVFLLDSRRMEGIPVPSRFDNRWMVFPQDFPSAAKLKSTGITTVLLVQKDEHQPAQDLAHVLAGWQEKGLTIMVDNVHDTLDPKPIQIRQPSHFRGLFYRAMILLGFRKNSAGGFGSMVPMPTESSGYG